jgi:hypothetical protein
MKLPTVQTLTSWTVKTAENLGQRRLKWNRSVQDEPEEGRKRREQSVYSLGLDWRSNDAQLAHMTFET